MRSKRIVRPVFQRSTFFNDLAAPQNPEGRVNFLTPPDFVGGWKPPLKMKDLAGGSDVWEPDAPIES
jgi:hypothetical protein